MIDNFLLVNLNVQPKLEIIQNVNSKKEELFVQDGNYLLDFLNISNPKIKIKPLNNLTIYILK